jgi:acyl-CoA thioesterase FadM
MLMFDDAAYHFLHEIGWRPADDQPRRVGWADVRHTIEYKREVREGALLIIESSPFALGRSSVDYRHVMLGADTRDVHAVLEARSVRFDLDRRAAIPIEDALRAHIADWIAQQGEVP